MAAAVSSVRSQMPGEAAPFVIATLFPLRASSACTALKKRIDGGRLRRREPYAVELIQLVLLVRRQRAVLLLVQAEDCAPLSSAIPRIFLTAIDISESRFDGLMLVVLPPTWGLIGPPPPGAGFDGVADLLFRFLPAVLLRVGVRFARVGVRFLAMFSDSFLVGSLGAGAVFRDADRCTGRANVAQRSRPERLLRGFPQRRPGTERPIGPEPFESRLRRWDNSFARRAKAAGRTRRLRRGRQSWSRSPTNIHRVPRLGPDHPGPSLRRGIRWWKNVLAEGRLRPLLRR